MSNKKDYFQIVPQDILKQIISYLPLDSLSKASKVNRRFFDTAKNLLPNKVMEALNRTGMDLRLFFKKNIDLEQSSTIQKINFYLKKIELYFNYLAQQNQNYYHIFVFMQLLLTHLYYSVHNQQGERCYNYLFTVLKNKFVLAGEYHAQVFYYLKNNFSLELQQKAIARCIVLKEFYENALDEKYTDNINQHILCEIKLLNKYYKENIEDIEDIEFIAKNQETYIKGIPFNTFLNNICNIQFSFEQIISIEQNQKKGEGKIKILLDSEESRKKDAIKRANQLSKNILSKLENPLINDTEQSKSPKRKCLMQ